MRGNRRYSSSFLVPVPYKFLTARKLAQVLIKVGGCSGVSSDLFVDALKVIQALGRVQRTFHTTQLISRRPDSGAKIAILLTNQVQCE